MDQLKKQSSEFRQCDVLLVVPPFADLSSPSLACHLLQAIAAKRGFVVRVLYGNIILASRIGEGLYQKAVVDATPTMVLERLFGIFAYGMSKLTAREITRVRPPELMTLMGQIPIWLDSLEEMIRRTLPKIVGCTSSFEQIASSVAVLNRCKAIDPQIITIIGGANCEDEMAEGILSLDGRIDHVFSGDSEGTFPEFLESVLGKREEPDQVIYGKPCKTMNQLPTPDYHEFFDQYERLIPASEVKAAKLWSLPFETSRGCWWGQKHHCTFCGLNGGGMNYRQKSEDRAFNELKNLLSEYPVNKVNMRDNIMPFDYFKNMLVRMGEELPSDLEIFYAQKANLTLQKVLMLRKGHISRIQPGIESLSSNILRLMDKGVKSYQNLALLRYARATGMFVNWNILCAFPGDDIDDYEEMLRLLPLFSHLQPPDGPIPLRIDRFSPYFMRPEQYGITNVRPVRSYAYAFPQTAKLHKLAYYFEGDYETAYFANPGLEARFTRALHVWQKQWDQKERPPQLRVLHLFEGQYVLHDTRGIPGTEPYQFLDQKQVHQVLAGGTLGERIQLEWAIEKKLLAEIDGRLVPLAIAPLDLFLEIEKSALGSEEIQERLAM